MEKSARPNESELKEIFERVSIEKLYEEVERQALVLKESYLILKVLKDIGHDDTVLAICKDRIEKVLRFNAVERGEDGYEDGCNTAGDVPVSTYNQRLMETLGQA
ncbi:MAG: hypothetical protein WC806_03535 [Candidatus Gracilibacteria bacterium]|jgi:hypothetical protein